MIRCEFAPITINVQDSMTIIKHTSIEEKINIASIESIDFIEVKKILKKFIIILAGRYINNC